LQGPQRQAPEGAQLFGARAAPCRNPDSGEARREKSRGIFRIELRCNVTFGLRVANTGDDRGVDRACCGLCLDDVDNGGTRCVGY
jgi:hypothetical protein